MTGEERLPVIRAVRFKELTLFLVGAIAGALVLTLIQRWQADALPPPRLEATVFLPLVDNNDRAFTDEKWQEVLGLFADAFGGATLGPEQEGAWRDDGGRVRREPIRLIVVSFEPGQLAEFRRVVDEAGSRLGQDAVYIRFERPHVEIRRVPLPAPK
jgi:hypothetical protein